MSELPSAVIFDFDGVIVDSTSYNRASINKLLEPHGFTTMDLRDSHGESHRGQSLRDILGKATVKYGVHFNVEDFSKAAGEIGFKMMQQDGKLEPDAHLVRFIDDLHRQGVLLGLGSSSMRWRVDRILGLFKLEGFFPVVVAAEDVSEHKPNPHIFLEVANRLAVSPASCLVVEDAPSGIQAAQRAGMKVVGFTGFGATSDSLSKADMLFNSFSELSWTKLHKLYSHV